MKNSINVAVIGSGYWGPQLLRNFSELNDANVLYCCDLDESRLKKVHTQYPHIKLTKDCNEVIKDPSIDAVAIATPPKTHALLALAALNAGKHVLVEKPFAYSITEAKEMMIVAQKQKKILMAGHVFLYNPAVQMLKKILKNPDFGKVHYLYSRRVNLGRIRDDANVIWNLAPHDISIMLYLLGDYPVSIQCWGRSFIQKDIEDVAFMILEFSSGILAHIHVGWLDPSKVREITVVGERKMVIYDDIDTESKLKIYDKGVDYVIDQKGHMLEYSLKLRSGDIVSPLIKWQEPLSLECQDFLNRIKNISCAYELPIDGIQVTTILEYAEQSLKNNGEKIDLPMWGLL